MLKKQSMDYVKDITLKYQKLNIPKLKNLCKANDVIEQLKVYRTKTKSSRMGGFSAVGPGCSLCKKMVIRAKSDEH